MDSVRLKYSSKKDILDELEGLDRNELKEPRAKKGGAKKGGAKKGGKKTTVVSVSSSSAEPSSSGTAADSSGSKRFDIIKQLQESPCNQCSEFSEHLKQINSQNKTQKDLGKLVSNLKDEVLIKSTEFKNKIRVLKELGFITKNDTLDIKGKFAQHISSADIIILTMFIFEGGFVSLKDDEMIASLAMTMIKAGSGTEEDIHPDYLPPSFFDNKTLLEELANQVLELEDKYGVQDEQRETKSRLNLAFPLVAYEWAKKTKFAEICKISLQEAGTMITALRSLVKLCEELSDAFKEISNEETSQRFKRLSEEMRRDILFLPSLYYEKDAKVNEDD